MLSKASESDRWVRSSRPQSSTGPSNRPYAPPIKTEASNEPWRRSKPTTPPRRGQGNFSSDYKDQWDEPQTKPRSPIVHPNKTSAGFVSSENRQGFTDTRPPPSRSDPFFRRGERQGGDDGGSWRSVGERHRGGANRNQSSNSGAYVPPYLRNREQSRGADSDKW